MLDPKFYAEPFSKESVVRYRTETLGINPSDFTVLLSTGANGAQNHFELIQAVQSLDREIQIIALCGRNQLAANQLQEQLSALHINTVKILGHQDDMLSLIQSCNIIVARPGTGTTSEAIMAGCPIIFNTLGGVMPQEWITIKYLRNRGLPIHRVRKPADLATVINELTASSKTIADYREQIINLRPANQPYQIFEYLESLANNK